MLSFWNSTRRTSAIAAYQYSVILEWLIKKTYLHGLNVHIILRYFVNNIFNLIFVPFTFPASFCFLFHSGNYSCLKVDLMFTRDRAFYFTTVFIPGIILVTSSFITFWLEWNAVPARVMIGMYDVWSIITTRRSCGFSFWILMFLYYCICARIWDKIK